MNARPRAEMCRMWQRSLTAQYILLFCLLLATGMPQPPLRTVEISLHAACQSNISPHDDGMPMVAHAMQMLYRLMVYLVWPWLGLYREINRCLL